MDKATKKQAMVYRERAFMVLGDLALIWLGLMLAVILRTDFNWVRSLEYLESETWFFLLFSLTAVAVFDLRGLYRRAWRYIGIGDAIDLMLALGIATVPFQFIALLALGGAFPRTGLLLAFFPMLVLLAGFRMAIRMAAEHRGRQRGGLHFLIVGWNDAAEVAVRELQRGGGEALGFLGLDARPSFDLRGVPYLGELEDVAKITADRGVNGLVLAGLTPSENLRVMRGVSGLGLELRTIPPVSKLLSGEVEVSVLRPLQLEDLLERDPVRFDPKRVTEYLAGERILVTGAGGSIGSEIVRQCLLAKPEMIILFGRGENSIHEMNSEIIRMSERDSSTTVVAFIGNIIDDRALTEVFEQYGPRVVFHAAAHKHVPLMESRPVEACANNIFGTLKLMEHCCRYGVKKMVSLSTDKAVNPSSVMGATKRVIELLLHTCGKPGFAAVRFGNVLGSRGSVIPTMQAQIAAGGPVTLTSRDMKRYFMTIPEAVSLVLGAGAMAEGGEIYVLDMGEPVRIADLAENLIRLSGMVPQKDIEIVVTGIRPGEKLEEALVGDGERCIASGWSGIHKVESGQSFLGWPGSNLGNLREAVDRGDEEAARRYLFALVAYPLGKEEARCDQASSEEPRGLDAHSEPIGARRVGEGVSVGDEALG